MTNQKIIMWIDWDFLWFLHKYLTLFHKTVIIIASENL